MSNQNGRHGTFVLAWGTLRHASLRERVEAASAAGFRAIGMAVPDYLRLLRAGWTDSAIGDLLAEHDVKIDEIEVLFGFAGPPGPANVPERPGLVYADQETEATAFHLADVYGARHLQATGRFGASDPGEEVGLAFRALCDRADQHGLRVALECVPYTDIRDVGSAGSVVAEADRPNGGLCIDAWHFFRSRSSFQDLAEVDPARIFMVQLSDGPVVPEDDNLARDAIHNRRCPGDGEFDLVRFLSTLSSNGAPPALSVEVYSDHLDLLEPRAAAALAGDASRTVMDEALRANEVDGGPPL